MSSLSLSHLSPRETYQRIKTAVANAHVSSLAQQSSNTQLKKYPAIETRTFVSPKQ